LSFFLSFLFSFLLLTNLSIASQAAPQKDGLSGEYRIGGNDVVEIVVYGEEGLTQEIHVTDSGYISYPFLGRIKVVGMSVVELEDYIRTALAKDYIKNPNVRVSVKEFSNIFVFGQVNQPGPYLFRGGMTVLQAISTAGGFTKLANSRKARIVREHGNQRQIIEVNVNNLTKGQSEDVTLQPGDTVVVPESFF